MPYCPPFIRRHLVQIVVLLGTVVCCASLWADHAHGTTTDPGYRPDSEYTAAFLEALDSSTIAVYPSLVRRSGRTAVSFASRELIIATLNAEHIATALTKNRRIDLGNLRGMSQWDAFQSSMQRIALALESAPPDVDYRLVMEFLLPTNDQTIFGVHCYILDNDGNNVFSFLLNSHHQSFVDARLFTNDSSEEARVSLIERATDLGLRAFRAQLEQARICSTHTALPAVIPTNGLIDDFEAGMPAGVDTFGNSLGFMTFSDGPSIVNIVAIEEYPPLPPKINRNRVLRMDMNVTGWAGVIHIFEDEAQDQWLAQNWSGMDELSFWFHGTNSGVGFFVDVLDNRSPCSTRDDAERYVYEFVDDFSGWERVIVRFKDMQRKEIGNGAPNDGLNLSSVHGWAIGALNTNGLKTFYIDDVDVRKMPLGKVHYPINEQPMFGKVQKTSAQLRADQQYIKLATKGGRSRKDAAELAAKTGWNLLYKHDDSTAIKRFNQAWLLDPNNQLALWGFATISGNRNEIEDAVRFFRMAIAAGPEQPALERDYQYALKQFEKSTDNNAPEE